MQSCISARLSSRPVRKLETAAAPGTAMESANCAPAECWGPPSLDFIVLPPLNGVRWAGFLLLLAASLGILFLVLGGVLSPETDLGFWSALSVPTQAPECSSQCSRHGL